MSNRPLTSLSVEETATWLRSVNLVVFADAFPARHVDGSELHEVETLDELVEEFPGLGSKLKLKKLLKCILTAKAEGVPLTALVVASAAPAASPAPVGAPAGAPPGAKKKKKEEGSALPPGRVIAAAKGLPPGRPATKTARGLPPGKVKTTKASSSAPPGARKAVPPPGAPPSGSPPPGAPPSAATSSAAKAAAAAAAVAAEVAAGAPPSSVSVSNRPKRRTMGGGNQFDVKQVKIFGAKLVTKGRFVKFHLYHTRVTLRNGSQYLLERQFGHFKTFYSEYTSELGELPGFTFPRGKHAGKRFTDRTVAKRILKLQIMMNRIVARALKRLTPPLALRKLLELENLEGHLESTAMHKAKRKSLAGGMEHEFVITNDFRKKRLGAEIESDKQSGRVFVVKAAEGSSLRLGDELVSIESEIVQGMAIDRVRALLATNAKKRGIVTMRFKRSASGKNKVMRKGAVVVNSLPLLLSSFCFLSFRLRFSSSVFAFLRYYPCPVCVHHQGGVGLCVRTPRSLLNCN